MSPCSILNYQTRRLLNIYLGQGCDSLLAGMPPETPTRNRKMTSSTSIDYDRYNFNDANLSTNSNMKYSHNVPALVSQSSLTSPDNHGATANQSLLAPPSFGPRERRLSASSSFDSSVSQSSRRRLRRNSSRLSDLDDDKQGITLLTFARALQKVCNKIGRCLRRAVSTLFVARPRQPNLVCDTDVIEQVRRIVASFTSASHQYPLISHPPPQPPCFHVSLTPFF